MLGGREAELHVPFVLRPGGIADDLVAGGAAEQLIHRPIQHLALQIPEREIDGAYGVRGDPRGAEGRAEPQHHVVDALRGQRRLADDAGTEVVVDQGGQRPAQRAYAETLGAVLGGDDDAHAGP